ncbi:MAG: hypothetical protein RSE93_00090 [Oscillospiraceae bacterium]
MKKNSLKAVLFKGVALVFLIYIIFIPIFYIIAIKKITNGLLCFILPNILRLLLVVLAGVYMRKKSKEVLLKDIQHTKIYFIVTAFLVAISIMLFLLGVDRDIYGTITATIGIFDMKNVFFIISWEQIFGNHFIFSSLICLLIIFFCKPNMVTKSEVESI